MIRRQVVRVGDRVQFDAAEYLVAGLDGTSVRLAPAGERTGSGVGGGGPMVVLLTHLLGAADFQVVSGPGPGAGLGSLRVLADLEPAVAERALWWERQVVELLSGLAPDAPAGTPVRAQYDPVSMSLRAREMTKTRELCEAGEQVSLGTVQRMRRRYQRAGIAGLVDGRLMPQGGPPGGRVDELVVEAVRQEMSAVADTSTVSRATLMLRVERRLRECHGGDGPVMPSRATFYRLVASLEAGRATFCSARTRRSLAGRPQGAHAVVHALRPGELMEIDSTPLDVLVVLDDGSTDRAELSGLVDVATRTIVAVVLRPSTKAVDAALLLARAVTPQLLRPGWADALGMARSVLPYPAMLSIDERLAVAAAQPVIFPETIVCDRGKVYVSAAFRSACQSLGISLQPAHPQTPTDKPVIERTLGSVSTLFAQHVAGYTGRSVEHRGADVAAEAVWPINALQDLLEEWVSAAWQTRRHAGLRDPFTPGVMLSPNEKYAALVAVAGYVPVALSADEYIELLPSCWRSIGAVGVRISHRSYDADALNPLRGQRSGVAGRGHRWQVHYDPYDVTRIWVRDHWNGGWIQVPWRHLSTAPAPFAEATWRHARQILARRGDDPVTEAQIADTVTALLDRAAAGPQKDHETATDLPVPAGSGALTAAARRKDRKVAARARAATPDRRAAPASLAASASLESDEPAQTTAKVAADRAQGEAREAGTPSTRAATGAGREGPLQDGPKTVAGKGRRRGPGPGPGSGSGAPETADPHEVSEQDPVAVVVPLEIFDARKEAKRRW